MNRNNKFFRLGNAVFLLVAVVCQSVGAQNRAWIDTLSSGPHQSVRFSVHVATVEPIVAFQSDIVLPSVLTFVPNSAQRTTRSDGHSLTASMISPNTLRVIIYSLSANAMNGTNGAVLTFDCLSGTQSGDYSVGLQSVVVSNASHQDILNDTYAGKFTLLAPDILLSNDSLDFGSIPLGQTLQLPLTISNAGNIPLSVTKISTSHSEIVMLDSSATVIDGNSAIIRMVSFRPLTKGSKIGILSIWNNEPVDSLRQVKMKAHAYAVNEIRVGSASARSGYQAAIRIRINNMEPFTAFQCRIPLPSVMKYVSGSAKMAGRGTDHTVVADTISGNILQVVCFSPTNAPFQGTDGDIAELKCNVEGQGGNYALPSTSSIITDSSGANILSASYSGDLRIVAPHIQLSSLSVSLGSVSIFDTARTQIQINNVGDDTLVISSATPLDTNYVVESAFPFIVPPWSHHDLVIRFHHGAHGTFGTQLTIVHNDVPRNPLKISLSASTFIPNTLQLVSVVGGPGDTLIIPIRMENAEPIVAAQFDLTIPSEVQFIPGSVVLSSRSNQHTLSTSILPNGNLRVLAFSMNQNPFQASTGDVVYLKIVAGGAQGVFPLMLSNIVLSNAGNENVVSSSANGTVTTAQRVLFAVEQSIFFGSVRIGSSATRFLTLRANSPSNVMLYSAGTSTEIFHHSAGLPTTINGNDSLRLELTFDAKAFGTFNDTLALISNGGNVYIPLIGNSPYPTLSSDQYLLSFGDVARNASKQMAVKIINQSINSLVLDTVYTKTMAFSVDRSGGTIDADTLSLGLLFSPTSAGAFVDTLYMQNNSLTPLVKIPLSGSTPPPALTAVDLHATYGDVAKGDSLSRILRFTNNSISPLTVTVVSVGTPAYTIDTSCHLPIAIMQDDTLRVTVWFKPTVFGVAGDTLKIESDGGERGIPLFGNSPRPTIASNPPFIDWSLVAKRSTEIKELHITNSSISALMVDSIFTHTGQFVADKIFGGAVSKDDTFVVRIAFTPDTFAIYRDTLFFRNNSLTPLFRVPLMGESPLPVLSIARLLYRRDTVAVGDSSVQRFVMFNTSLNELSYQELGTRTAVFSVTGSPSGTVKSLDSAIFSIVFKPSRFALFEDTMSVTSIGGVKSCPLSGFSPYPSMILSTSMLNFGDVLRDSTATENIIVKNVSINKLRIDSMKTDAKQFVVNALTSPIFVSRTDSAVFAVFFSPDSVRLFTDTLRIYSNQFQSLVKIPLTGSRLTSVALLDNVGPTEFALNQNYPNPFNPSTTLRYGLPMRSNVILRIYNILGQQVAELVNTEQAAGWYRLSWNANVASGIYIYRLEAVGRNNPNQRFVDVKKMVLLR